MKICNNKNVFGYLKASCLALYLLLFSFFICLLSRQNAFTSVIPSTDSSVFLTIAKGMKAGKVPYLDFFDHKGPFLYFLNYWGYSLGGIHGVWIVEIIAVTTAVFFTYMTTKKLYGHMIALCSTTVGYLFLHLCLDGGNLTEEYALPLISIAVYISVSALLSENFSIWQVLALGFTFGISLMLRPNMFSVWFIFSAYWVIVSIIKKNYSVALKYILFFALGAVASISPFIIYLLYNNILYDYIYQNFIFNSQYAAYGGIQSIIKNIFHVMYWSYAIVLSLVSCVVGFFTQKKNRQVIFILLFLSTILSILLVSISQAVYKHYFMVFTPIITVTFGVLFELFKKIAHEYGMAQKWTYVILIGLVICFGLNGICRVGYTFISNAYDIPNKEITALTEIINEGSNENDSLQVIGNECSIYLYTDLEPANKFIYDFPIANISTEVHGQFVQAWKKNSPTYVVIDPHFYVENDTEHRKWVTNELDNNYSMIYATENYTVYQRQN